jgi:hypothetical protein
MITPSVTEPWVSTRPVNSTTSPTPNTAAAATHRRSRRWLWEPPAAVRGPCRSSTPLDLLGPSLFVIGHPACPPTARRSTSIRELRPCAGHRDQRAAVRRRRRHLRLGVGLGPIEGARCHLTVPPVAVPCGRRVLGDPLLCPPLRGDQPVLLRRRHRPRSGQRPPDRCRQRLPRTPGSDLRGGQWFIGSRSGHDIIVAAAGGVAGSCHPTVSPPPRSPRSPPGLSAGSAYQDDGPAHTLAGSPVSNSAHRRRTPLAAREPPAARPDQAAHSTRQPHSATQRQGAAAPDGPYPTRPPAAREPKPRAGGAGYPAVVTIPTSTCSSADEVGEPPKLTTRTTHSAAGDPRIPVSALHLVTP